MKRKLSFVVERKPLMGGSAQPSSFSSKEEMYSFVLSVAKTLLEPSPKMPPVVNLNIALANLSSLLFYSLNAVETRNHQSHNLHHLAVNWVGFYLVVSPTLMALGPFQGKVACTEIAIGKGVCGTVALKGEPQLVENVHDFPGHIACDSESESEVVVPIKKGSAVVGVIDVDSTSRAYFDNSDISALVQLADLVGSMLSFPYAADSVHQTSHSSTDPAPAPALVPALEPQIMTLNGWEFHFTQHPQMASQFETESLQQRTGVRSLPEIMFGGNSFKAIHQHRNVLCISISLSDVMKNAASYYETGLLLTDPSATLLYIPSSDQWKKKSFAVFDAKIDWAWRNNFVTGRSQFVPCEHQGINFDLLKDQRFKIMFCGAFQIFEDDLHDHGVSKFDVKFRVMEYGFFILSRHYVAVNSAAAVVREVRIYHEFGKSNGSLASPVNEDDSYPLVPVEISIKYLDLSSKQMSASTPIDEVIPMMAEIFSERGLITPII